VQLRHQQARRRVIAISGFPTPHRIRHDEPPDLELINPQLPDASPADVQRAHAHRSDAESADAEHAQRGRAQGERPEAPRRSTRPGEFSL